MDNPKPTRSTGSRWFILFGSFFVLIALVAIRATADDEPVTAVIIGIVFGLTGLFFAIAGIRQWYTRYRVGKPEVQISKQTAVLGDNISISFHNTFNREVNVETFSIKLIFKETATYQQGTNTKTVHHEEIIDEYNTVGQRFSAGSFLSESHEFTLPRDAMHSVDVRRNQLKWFIRFEMDIPRMMNFQDDYEITVLPELTSREWD
ncbi:MAG: phage holin family protein [Chloroflexota bacterium]